MKNILVNGYFMGNFGDDLFFKILFDRYKNVNWKLLCENSAYKKIYKNVEIIELSFLQKVLRKIKLSKQRIKIPESDKYDGLIFIGGSIFLQWDGWEEEFKERYNLVQEFKENNKKIFVLGANFGPYKEENYFDSYVNLLSLCDDICFRENHSYDIFKSLNNIRVAPDIVFQLKTPKVKKKKNSVGFSLLDLTNRKELTQYKDKYELKMKKLIEEYINLNHEVTLFSFCEIEGDMRVIKRIIKIIDKKYLDKINIINYDGNIDGFLREFQSMEVIIGTRFHSVILSQVFDQGIFPIIYSDKTYNSLKDINLDKNYTYIKDIEDLKIDEVIKKSKSNKICEKDIFVRSEIHFDELDKLLEQKNI